MAFLPLSMIQGWLFTIQVNMVRPDLREKLIEFQKECFEALDSYWRRGFAINPRFEKIEITEKFNDGIEKTPNQRFFEQIEEFDKNHQISFFDYFRQIHKFDFFDKATLTRVQSNMLEVQKLINPHMGSSFEEKAKRGLRYYSLVQMGLDFEYINTGYKKITKQELGLIESLRKLPQSSAEIYHTQIIGEQRLLS